MQMATYSEALRHRASSINSTIFIFHLAHLLVSQLFGIYRYQPTLLLTVLVPINCNKRIDSVQSSKGCYVMSKQSDAQVALNDAQKKSRPDPAASSVYLPNVGQFLKADVKIVALVQPLASKSQRRVKSGKICKDAMRGQFALHGTLPSTHSVRIESLRRLEEARENDDGLTLFDRKVAVMRVVGGAV